MGKCDIKVNKAGDKLNVSIGGTIDEDIDFSMYSLAGGQQVDIDMNQIKSINSCGIREWIKWMGTAGSASIQFINCPKVIVDQINMVDGFLPGSAKVQSFYVPYYNDDSGAEKNILFVRGTHFDDGSLTPPEGVKDDSGNEMEMDVIEAKYFKFLKR